MTTPEVPKTRGFLYYHQPPRAPPLAGQLRFHVTGSDDPASFSSGTDLTTERGVPWYIPLPVTASAGYRMHTPIRRLLTDVDGLVPQQVMDLARAQEHPFDLTLDSASSAFALVGRDRIARMILPYVICFYTGTASRGRLFHLPFSGTALCCFEPSALPEHAGKRVAVVRVLRSLESDPVRPNPLYAGLPIPPELYPQDGQLLMALRFRKPRVWAGHVDKETSVRTTGVGPLRILFDNAIEYGYP
ncbi:hypothetical protein C8T65DRAFT_745113 [Cerioporus squamosus]|nr:hypothetical protein C8T65DRAFT_745113 [Cerioporus squamosus]